VITESVADRLAAVTHITCRAWIASYVLPLRRWAQSRLIGPSALRVSESWLLEHDLKDSRRGDD
jgi:hypothetical protein